MTEPDVRALYAALGIALTDRPGQEASVRCFADPDAHQHRDRSPSCSVNLATGAWNCHGCGASGGAYDAALAVGHTPSSAMRLLVAHGLARPRTHDTPSRRPAPRSRAARRPTALDHYQLGCDDDDARRWAQALHASPELIARLSLARAWTQDTMRELQLGLDRGRITIPVRSGDGRLRGLLRYDPFGRRDPKMLAVPGTRLGLIPHPDREPSDHILLVEGPPDMIAARSARLPAIAVPGTHAWKPEWAQLFAARTVTIVMDCDPPGRQAAQQIAHSLQPTAGVVSVLDLAPARDDGYDLTNHLLEHPCRTLAGDDQALSFDQAIGRVATVTRRQP